MQTLKRCIPGKDDAITTLKQLSSAAMGMVGALALNAAMKATFEEIGPAGIIVLYAVLVSLLSIYVLAALKLVVEPKAKQAGGEKGTALTALFKVSFCLLSAAAWGDVIELVEDPWPLLGIAIALTLGLVVVLIIIFKSYDAWQSASCKSSCHFIPVGILNYFLVGLVIWTPITFGFICGAAWNEFFVQLFAEIGSDGTRIVVAFAYAAFTVPLAIGVIMLTQKVKESGWCCPGALGQPCCGLENKIADPLCNMFEGEAAAIMAFGWNSAFETVWKETTGDNAPESDGSSSSVNVGILIAYAVVAVIFGVLIVLGSRSCAKS
eukprot:TRINITY_DN5284_c0_g2_i3.p1 TRINITY_DN5284_c0_g2~~TRINITY_DN5284_c0_g2_i3.p1  ORF type:complete len:322 (+),score=62.82 TRINITY_DN5284_c0_g2_i3:62-1027(+)